MAKSKNIANFDSTYDVVVVGAGNGGLGAALKLAVDGAKPLLLEQHNVPGGFATSFVRGRFEFDASLHELADVGPEDFKGNLRKFLIDEAGVDLEFVRIPEAYRVILTKYGIDVSLPFGVEEYGDAIAEAVPGSREPIKKYLEFCEGVYEALGYIGGLKEKADPAALMKDVADFVKTSDSPVKDALKQGAKLMNFVKTIPCSAEEVTDTFGIPDRAKDILYPYWCYLGIPMSRMNFTIWCAMLIDYLQKGAYTLKNRSQELTYAMEARIRELGGDVEYNTRVEKILVEKGRVIGVETSAGERIGAPVVISNASQTLAYNKLISPKSEVPEIAYKYCNARSHGSTGICIYIGLDESYKKLGFTDYGYFISDDMDTEAIYDSMQRLGLVKMQATTCLNAANPACSPRGTTILSIVTLYNADCWAGVKPKDYHRLKNKIASGMIDQFEGATGIKIRDHIEEIEIATPATFARYTRTYKGIFYGYEPDPWDGAIPRVLSLKDEEYIKGLLFAGGCAHMCHGYNSSIQSGRAAAVEAIGRMGGVA